MKLKATKKEIKEGYYKIIGVGYCEAQHLLNYRSPFAYSAGYYGWSCDYYDVDGVCISTGYNYIDNKHTKADYELIRKYDDLAQGKEKEEREALLKEFISIATAE